jgi:hypothetical protein
MPAEKPQPEHVSVAALWKHRAQELELSPDEMDHVLKCEYCMSVLGVCHMCRTITEVERRVKNEL